MLFLYLQFLLVYSAHPFLAVSLLRLRHCLRETGAGNREVLSAHVINNLRGSGILGDTPSTAFIFHLALHPLLMVIKFTNPKNYLGNFPFPELPKAGEWAEFMHYSLLCAHPHSFKYAPLLRVKGINSC